MAARPSAPMVAARAERVWAHMAGAHTASRGAATETFNRDLDPRDEFNAR